MTHIQQRIVAMSAPDFELDGIASLNAMWEEQIRSFEDLMNKKESLFEDIPQGSRFPNLDRDAIQLHHTLTNELSDLLRLGPFTHDTNGNPMDGQGSNPQLEGILFDIENFINFLKKSFLEDLDPNQSTDITRDEEFTISVKQMILDLKRSRLELCYMREYMVDRNICQDKKANNPECVITEILNELALMQPINLGNADANKLRDVNTKFPYVIGAAAHLRAILPIHPYCRESFDLPLNDNLSDHETQTYSSLIWNELDQLIKVSEAGVSMQSELDPHIQSIKINHLTTIMHYLSLLLPKQSPLQQQIDQALADMRQPMPQSDPSMSLSYLPDKKKDSNNNNLVHLIRILRYKTRLIEGIKSDNVKIGIATFKRMMDNIRVEYERIYNAIDQDVETRLFPTRSEEEPLYRVLEQLDNAIKADPQAMTIENSLRKQQLGLLDSWAGFGTSTPMATAA